MWSDLALTLIGAILFGAILWTHRILRRSIRRPPAPAPRLARYPSVTVVRPIRGLDVDEDLNLAAALDTGYPGPVHTIFVFDERSDPAFPLVERLVRGRADASVIIAGPPPPGRTGKLNAMIAGAERAGGELIAFGDSDTRPDRDVLRLLVEKLLTTPRAGATFAPAVVDLPARTAGDVGYALLLNAWYGASVAHAAGPDGELPFIMGQLMVFTREALDAIGGLACVDGQLVDDMALGQHVARAGYRNLLIDHPLAIENGGMRFADFVRLMRRWLLFGHNGLPLRFTGPNWLRGAEVWIALLAAGLAFAIGHPLGAIAPSVAVVASMVSQAVLHRAFGGAPVSARHAWMTCAVPLLGPAVVISTLVDRRVTWRGHTYTLDLAAGLRAPPR